MEKWTKWNLTRLPLYCLGCLLNFKNIQLKIHPMTRGSNFKNIMFSNILVIDKKVDRNFPMSLFMLRYIHAPYSHCTACNKWTRSPMSLTLNKSQKLKRVLLFGQEHYGVTYDGFQLQKKCIRIKRERSIRGRIGGNRKGKGRVCEGGEVGQLSVRSKGWKIQ